MAVGFQQVQSILNTITANWTAGNGGVAPDYLGAHRTQTFAWDTRANLLNSVARGDKLIQPGIIGQKGLGATANLVVALTTGVTPFPAMPDGGLNSTNGVFLTPDSPEIKTIIAWIEGGCLP
jgi:hypothetical protein